MAKTSATIDISALKVAGEGASKYITSIDSNNGIQVHAASNASTNYVQINADGMEIVKNGDSIADFGSTIRLGQDNSSRITIGSSALRVYGENNEYLDYIGAYDGYAYARFGSNTDGNGCVYINTNPLSGELTSTPRIRINDGTKDIISIYKDEILDDEGGDDYNLGSGFGGFISLGSSANFSKGMYIGGESIERKNDSTKIQSHGYIHVAQQGESSSLKIDVGTTVGIYLQRNSDYIDLYVGNGHLEINNGGIVVNQHDGNVGEQLSGDGSKSMSSSTTLAKVKDLTTLSAGSWIIVCSVRFPSASSGTRGAQIYLNGSGSGCSYATQSGFNGVGALTCVTTTSSSSDIDVDIYARQSSGGSQTVSYEWRAMRIA